MHRIIADQSRCHSLPAVFPRLVVSTRTSPTDSVRLFVGHPSSDRSESERLLNNSAARPAPKELRSFHHHRKSNNFVVGDRLEDTAHRRSVAGRDPGEETTLLPHRKASAAVLAGNFRQYVSAFFQVSDNRLSMKLFGNRNALQREKLRQKAVGNWVIHPCSMFR